MGLPGAHHRRVRALLVLRQPAPALAGLLAAGIGVANLFPLSLALTPAAVPEQADAANGAAQLLGGLLVIAAPLALGVLADQVGLRAAFATEPSSSPSPPPCFS